MQNNLKWRIIIHSLPDKLQGSCKIYKIVFISSGISRSPPPSDDDYDDVWYRLHRHGPHTDGLPVLGCSRRKGSAPRENGTNFSVDTGIKKGT